MSRRRPRYSQAKASGIIKFQGHLTNPIGFGEFLPSSIRSKIEPSAQLFSRHGADWDLLPSLERLNGSQTQD